MRRSAGGYVPSRRILPIDTPFSVSFFHTAQVVDSTSEVVLRSSEVDPTTSEFFVRETLDILPCGSDSTTQCVSQGLPFWRVVWGRTALAECLQ